MKIYTKTGDTGETSLFSGGRVPKDDGRVEAYGTVDELNSWLGLVRSNELPFLAETWLEKIQNDLFKIGADLATPLDSNPAWLVRMDEAPAQDLEAWIDQMDADLIPPKSFILPGGCAAAAQLHIARTVCRRAERLCVTLQAGPGVNAPVIIYMNRLSDFLFTLARWVNLKAGVSETKWISRP
jgi:cob(I)alamin adenosyltransferase